MQRRPLGRREIRQRPNSIGRDSDPAGVSRIRHRGLPSQGFPATDDGTHLRGPPQRTSPQKGREVHLRTPSIGVRSSGRGMLRPITVKFPARGPKRSKPGPPTGRVPSFSLSLVRSAGRAILGVRGVRRRAVARRVASRGGARRRVIETTVLVVQKPVKGFGGPSRHQWPDRPRFSRNRVEVCRGLPVGFLGFGFRSRAARTLCKRAPE